MSMAEFQYNFLFIKRSVKTQTNKKEVVARFGPWGRSCFKDSQSPLNMSILFC